MLDHGEKYSHAAIPKLNVPKTETVKPSYYSQDTVKLACSLTYMLALPTSFRNSAEFTVKILLVSTTKLAYNTRLVPEVHCIKQRSLDLK